MNSEFKFDFMIKNVHSQVSLKFLENHYVDVTIIPNIYQSKSIQLFFTIASFREAINSHLFDYLLINIRSFRMNQLSKLFIQKVEQLCYHSLSCIDALV